MIHTLVPSNSSILKHRLEEFDFVNPPTDPIQLAHDLAETMLYNDGLGLSANQIGLPYRAFAIKAEKIIVCFNPRIVDYSEETIYLEEGCLSYPNLYIKVKRPKKIKIRYVEPNGNTVTKTFNGLTARVALHEYDHLEGITYMQRANRFHIDQAKKNKKTGKIPKVTTNYIDTLSQV
jgi:peptide deformylase